jgi:sugar-specific transcriptional regulator TrmB
MDKQHRVEAKTAELAKASAVPLGSLHSILVSLEKKHMIKTERQGSPKHPAIYQVLETSRKAMSTLNGAVHSKTASSQSAAS